ncbi:uncharacterized protein F5Z01DRAFT_361339 [Emericellopsis atlantica]|uniref:Hpc2-related domain-containing protein n=1 Tax=Emericellopsis atlantica TaxID=2614577 RepID=A0A9P8CKI7_9HYPO|nr:uncharacterized protein F5Z01DRAFT_361339 [Emericellopsis atlantica]KAG9250604.1 hypothetical protein F5Z01DRAFT_361339 [Emericellopsis atlantica]
MDTSRYESSPGELSSPPSGPLSEPGTPSRKGLTKSAAGRTKMDEEIMVSDDQRAKNSDNSYVIEATKEEDLGNGTVRKYGLISGEWVQLTAAGVPRKKPGRKPGMAMKPRGEGSDAEKTRKPRKPRDPNAPSSQRKRKTGHADLDGIENAGPSKVFALGAPNEPVPQYSRAEQHQHSAPQQPHHQLGQPQTPYDQRHSPVVAKRDNFTNSMQSILNSDTPARPPSSAGTAMPVRSSGQSYDPIRDGKYDPVRESMGFSSNTGSPRAPSQAQPAAAQRSPSIASLLDPHASAAQRSPGQGQGQGQGLATGHNVFPPPPSRLPTETSTPRSADVRKEQAQATSAPTPTPKPVIKESQFTTIANGPVKRSSPKQKAATGMSTPRADNLDDMQEGEGRSILDFGRAKPGEETQAPTIVLDIPIQVGETNKYVNFLRLAEDRFGWDALHPRLAADRDRKARIAAAAAHLEKAESGRDSDDVMSDMSDNEGSNLENGVASGVDAQAKPKKKRIMKEDNYDIDDDFVDDSEMLWEAQAAASRDGFFVYSGPLVPEVEKPERQELPKRGRGSRGGRMGTRGGTTRGGASSGGAGRGGGPGSRGGTTTRKPRISKAERAQRELEKSQRESLSKLGEGPPSTQSIHPTTPSTFSVTELGA